MKSTPVHMTKTPQVKYQMYNHLVWCQQQQDDEFVIIIRMYEAY